MTNANNKKRILIYGVTDAAQTAFKMLRSEKTIPVEIVGFIDESPEKYGKSIFGKRILGNRHHIKALAQIYKIDEYFMTLVEQAVSYFQFWFFETALGVVGLLILYVFGKLVLCRFLKK